MANAINGYHGVLLEIDLSNERVNRLSLSPDDALHFIGGRGLGMKILWDRLNKPGIDALSPENPLMFLPGPFSGLPIPAASRTCVVTKSPLTSPVESKYPHASTLAYSNVGGFLGPEIKFAGYDGIIITGKADSPVYIVIEDDRVEIKDARKYWGMKTNDFDRIIANDLGDRRFETCYIGPAGENLARYSAIIHTSSRAAGRGGVGCVMGSKNVKALAVKGARMPGVADHKKFLKHLDEARESFKNVSPFGGLLNRYGTAFVLNLYSDLGRETVKNFREATFPDVGKIGAIAAEQRLWVRDTACYCCPIACKKISVGRNGSYGDYIVEGPEYETGTMMGSNLLISDLDGMMKVIGDIDDYGLDQISTGNVIGFLMECYEKGYIDKKFLDGIELKWGDVGATLAMTRKIAYREGIGELASLGVKALASEIGRDSHTFAIHCKGQELAAHNVHANPPRALCYITSNRGACHLNGDTARAQNLNVMNDSIGQCYFSTGCFGKTGLTDILQAITGHTWNEDMYVRTGERIFNLEKCFNYREGFRRIDDALPQRFYDEPLTVGPKKGAVLVREDFKKMMDSYYTERGWDQQSSRPSQEKLSSLGLAFAWEEIKG